MTMVLHSMAATARLQVQYILAVLETVLYGAFVMCNTASGLPPGLTPEQASVMNSLPKDVRTVASLLGLEPDIVRYACCPKCFAIYPPDLSHPDDPYPHVCTFQETDKPACGSPLVYRQIHAPTHKKGPARTTFEPIRVYPYLPLQSWLKDLVTRPALRQYLRSAWQDTNTSDRWTDIRQAEAFRSFLGPDRKLFSEQPDGSYHLIFSLFVDWFNPFGNKKAGKSHSIGGIYLVCHNLPEHLRYRVENMYLAAIIPGPKEPALHQLNHLLRPLIDELLALWYRGIYFSNPTPELSVFVRAAVIPLVCDIPALRKTGGFAGHSSSHFCSFCQLLKDNINDLDRRHWPHYSWQEHLLYATEWLKAPTEARREAVFKAHGLRWSELLRLPYWDPTRFAVVDAMHNLFLGELRHHCRDVWGLNVKDKSHTDGSSAAEIHPHNPAQQREQLRRAHDALLSGARSTLKKIRKGYITSIARFNAVAPQDGLQTKSAYIESLIEWVGYPSNLFSVPQSH